MLGPKSSARSWPRARTSGWSATSCSSRGPSIPQGKVDGGYLVAVDTVDAGVRRDRPDRLRQLRPHGLRHEGLPRSTPPSSASSIPSRSRNNLTVPPGAASMQLAEVIGTVVASIKDANMTGTTLLVIQPLGIDGKAVGKTAGGGRRGRRRRRRRRVLRARARSRLSVLSHRSRPADAGDHRHRRPRGRELRPGRCRSARSSAPSSPPEAPQARRREAAARPAARPRTARRAARPLLAIDSVGAGIGERVLVVIEGKAAGDALGRKAAPVDAAIVGIIDQIDFESSS